jgi:hypothetical protein
MKNFTKKELAASRPKKDPDEAIDYALELEVLSFRETASFEIATEIAEFYNKKQTKRRKPQWLKKQSNP